MVNYALKENKLVEDSKNCVAVVTSHGVATIDDIIDHMIAEGAGLTRPQALAYFEKMSQTVEYFIRMGFTVSTPLFKSRTSITGTFENKHDNFDPERHQTKIKTISGNRLRKLEKELQVTKTRLNRVFPRPETLSDTSTETENNKITCGGAAVLRGSQLRFDPLDIEQGIFFIAAGNPCEKIRVEKYIFIRSNEVCFQIPDLKANDYILVVTTSHYTRSSIRKGEMNCVLSVDN